MKRISAVWAAMLLLGGAMAHAQERDGTGDIPVRLRGTVVPLHLDISETKTTNLIFPYPITSVDRGSRSVIAQKPRGVENILQVKAAVRFGDTTNLTIVTSDGAFYSFLVSYAARASYLNVRVMAQPGDMAGPVAMFTTGRGYEDVIRKNAVWVSLRQPSMNGPRARKVGIEVGLKGVYISGDLLYFQLALENDGNIPYDVGQLRMFVRDRKAGRRTASQEVEMSPVIVHGESGRINPRSSGTVVIGLKKFTIPDRKRFHLQLMEKDGGRNLELKIGNGHITGAGNIR